MYEVLAVRYGTLASTKSQLYHRYAAYGEPDGAQDLDFYFWVLRNEDGAILIDTGFDPVVAARRGRTCLYAPCDALDRLGIARDSVRQVVLTHLHYDHTGNLGAFPAAEVLVPQRELAFWTGPLAHHHQFAEHIEVGDLRLLRRLERDGRVRTYEGPDELSPGVTAVLVGGHSPAQHMVLVRGPNNAVLLTSDAVHLYEELERSRPFGVIVDLEAMYTGYDKARDLAIEQGAVIVPGHDPQVMQRFPAVEGCADLAVRVA